jgi:hypothetical protein
MKPEKQALREEIARQGFRQPDWRHKDPLPLVSIEQFFDGNDDSYSIAVNLEPHPALVEFRRKLIDIRNRDDVCAVLMEIFDIDEARECDESWPYCERVYVITAAGEAQATKWNRDLSADGPVEGWALDPPVIEVPANHRVWQIIWD